MHLQSMGSSAASRTEKLRKMKTSNKKKTSKKMNLLAKKGKLPRHIIDKMMDIKRRAGEEGTKKFTNITDDWQADRERHFDDNQEDILPLDMLDADIDWENSAFAGVKRRYEENMDEGSDNEGLENKKRKFAGQLDENMEEMLPIKLQDGTLVRPTREKMQSETEANDEELEEQQETHHEGQTEEPKFEDLTGLSAADMLAKRKELIAEAKEKISTLAHFLLSNPQENILKLRDLFHMCEGKDVHPIIRENITKLAIASTVQVLIDIVPGYAIRSLTDEERQQKQTKQTRMLANYEESLLRYYLKYLQLCEKNANKFLSKSSNMDEETFTFKLGLLSLKAMARLMVSCPHFNYTTNIISTMVRLTLSKIPVVVEESAGALSRLFKEDLHLKMSLFGARSIATLVTKRKGRVSPRLIATFLDLNIKEVHNENKKSGKGRIFSQRARLKKEKQSKTAKKYKKTLDKLESDLKELDAAETISTKLKHATEAMRHVFQTYFSVLKRMPNLKLLEPVLEGLSKFAHMLNVEFFEDIVRTMEELIEQQHLRVLDQLHCIYTVFVVLSDEGQLLNVDPSRFYRSAYRILNSIPFETNPDLRVKQLTFVGKTLDLMLNERRKQVPLARAAAFTKRILSLATVMDDRSATCLIALVRSFFIAHPKLISITEDDEGGGGAGGICRPDIDDPDVANALGSNVILELRMLARRRHKSLHQFAQNIQHGVPSTGQMRLSPQLTSIKPWDLLQNEIKEFGEYTSVDMKYMDDVMKFSKKKASEVSSKNIQFHIMNWLESRPI